MDIKVLSHIHELLIKDVNDARRDLGQAHDKRRETDHEDEHYQLLLEICFEKKDYLKEAESALKAFEEYKW